MIMKKRLMLRRRESHKFKRFAIKLNWKEINFREKISISLLWHGKVPKLRKEKMEKGQLKNLNKNWQ